jgi:para-nitrobenzyl esterase
MITGTPDQVQPGVAFTIQVTDAKSQSATQAYTMKVKSSPTVVQAQSGLVQGVMENNLLEFRGIPYAAPPVGNLRWRPPQPLASWSGIKIVTAIGNPCPQMSATGVFSGDEDCLTLNVFVSETAQSQKQPVMVFLHGGGNRRGDTNEPPYNMPLLATQGVIVVTVEYRLGLLGFFANSLLTAEGGGSSGNYGIMDQIAALAWVHNNIAAFGGDPAHAMVFGQSAGSTDVQVLLFAPAAQGLFSTAGMESDVFVHGQVPALAGLETQDEPIVSLLGCGAAADVLACLRAVPTDVIVSNQSAVPHRSPTIDSRVLPVDPFDALQQNGSPVPLLIGSNSEETASLQDDPNTPLGVNGYATTIHNEFDPFGAGVGSQVLSLYPASAYDTPEYALIAVHSDFIVTCETRTTARAAAGATRPSVWRYLYTHRFENDASLNVMRAFHGAELSFVFGNLQSAPAPGGSYTPSSAEVALANQIMGYWTRFAATGDPNGSGTVPWPRYDATTDAMLQLDDTPAQANGYHTPQCDYLVTLPQP